MTIYDNNNNNNNDYNNDNDNDVTLNQRDYKEVKALSSLLSLYKSLI